MFTGQSKIIHSELQNANIETLTSQDTKLIKRNLRNVRTSILPKLPSTLCELHDILDNMEFKTNKNKNFLLINSKETNIVGSSALSNLKVICDSDTIFVDDTCTFIGCPKFNHTNINTIILPLLRLKNRTENIDFAKIQLMYK